MAAEPVNDELRWLAHVLSGEPNPLRRSIDRWAAGLTAALLLLALALLPLAALIGHGVHQRMLAEAAEQAATHRQVSAELVEPSRLEVLPSAHPQTQVQFEAVARWSAPDGRSYTGPIEVTSRGVPGDRVDIWIDGNGQRVPPPVSEQRALAAAISTGVLVVIGGGALCAVAALGVRVLAESVARSAWGREWEDVSRRWTGRGSADAG